MILKSHHIWLPYRVTSIRRFNIREVKFTYNNKGIAITYHIAHDIVEYFISNIDIWYIYI